MDVADVRPTLDDIVKRWKDDPRVAIADIYVYGKDAYEKMLKRNARGKELFAANNWYADNKFIVLNTTIPADDKHGPYEMDDLEEIPPCPTVCVKRVIDHLEDYDYFGMLTDLSKDYDWKIRNGDTRIRPAYCMPHSVSQAFKFVRENCGPELVDCTGVIVLPIVVDFGSLISSRIHTVRREVTVNMIDLEPGARFIVQTCRARFYERPIENTCYVMCKERLDRKYPIGGLGIQVDV